MCAEYQINTSDAHLRKAVGDLFENISEQNTWNLRVKMSLKAPVLGIREGRLKLNELYFPVRPFPNARLSQLQSNKQKTTVNEMEDQIIRIHQVPLWKTGFEKFPCIVPMTSFFEPAYWGKDRGAIIEFAPGEETLLFVPALLVRPTVPATGKLNGFSLLTHTASDQMFEFHHRLLVFLKPTDALEYLRRGFTSTNERFNFLLQHRYFPALKTSVERRMAKGWEKRSESHLLALEEEKKYHLALKRETVNG